MAAELIFTGGRLGHAGDTAIGDDALDLGTARVAELLTDQACGGLCHRHGLRLERLTDAHTAAIDGRTDTNLGQIMLLVHAVTS